MATGDIYADRLKINADQVSGALPGTGTASVTITGTAGEALDVYDIVYSDASESGKYKKANKDIDIAADAVGIVTEETGILNDTTGEITAIGAYALSGNTTGNLNTAVGDLALISNTTGSSNTAFGRDALRLNITANNGSLDVLSIGDLQIRDNNDSRQVN